MTRRPRWLLALLGVLAAVLVPFSVSAQPAAQSVGRGALYALRGTPHLWIGGDDGALHWAGDTRALLDRFVDWSSRREVSLDELRALRRGDPWLSTGLLKMGDPIYLVKWETAATAPVLLHIQSLADVELFGLNSANYGALIQERAALERRLGVSVDTLQRGALEPAVPPTVTPTPAVTATPIVTLRAEDLNIDRSGGRDFTRRVENRIQITGALPRTKIYAWLSYEEYLCAPECSDTQRGTWGPIEIGVTDAAGKLIWIDRHGPYKRYTYTFSDSRESGGNTAKLEFYDDL
jgi:hypothetical protein